MKNKMNMNRLLLMTVGTAVINCATTLGAIVVDFDDLAWWTTLTGSGYAGLTWEQGNEGYRNNTGYWVVESQYPHSEPHNAINGYGCTLIGIGFATEVDVLGAYFAGQGQTSNWTTGVRVHGYRGDIEVATTVWFSDFDAHPDWFAMNLNNVDRIVIESIPVNQGGGWYGMDDLTYVPEPATVLLLGLGGVALLRKRRV